MVASSFQNPMFKKHAAVTANATPIAISASRTIGPQVMMCALRVENKIPGYDGSQRPPKLPYPIAAHLVKALR
jgi:hypothetical protein